MEKLEARTVNGISFQEIIGHFKEIYKQNERSISSLEERLAVYGYSIPGKTEWKGIGSSHSICVLSCIFCCTKFSLIHMVFYSQAFLPDVFDVF